MKKLEAEEIKNVLDGMLGHIEQEKIDLYKALMEKGGKIPVDSYGTFHISLIYPHEKFLDGLIKTEISKDADACFILKRSSYIESHFRNWIEQKEGSACCADKSRAIVNALLKWFMEGKQIEWNYSQEYTYHLPKDIFKTHDDILLFYYGIKSLYYGNPKQYLEALKNIMSIA